MLSYRLGTFNDFHWEFKPVLSYSKPHTFSTFFGEEKKAEFLEPITSFCNILSISSLMLRCENTLTVCIKMEQTYPNNIFPHLICC